MVTKTKKRRPGAARRSGPGVTPAQAQAPASVTTTAAAPTTNFRCSACEKTRPLERDGHPYFIIAKNEGKLCLLCVGERDRKALEEGRITMNVQREGNDWWAIALSGKYRFRLPLSDGQTEMQMLSAPEFTDREGNVWTGRMYPKSGLVHFQRKGKATAVSPARRGKRQSSAVLHFRPVLG